MVSFGRISPNSFLSSILLVVVIIVTVVIVMVILIVIVVAIVGVVIVVAIFGVVVVVDGDPIGLFYSDRLAYTFHQDKASLVRVPVANVTLSSSAHLLRENTDSFPLFATGISLGPVFLLGLSAFDMVAACASRAAIGNSVVSKDELDNVVEEEDVEQIRFLGGNNSSGTKKYQGSNSSDGGNTGDRVKIAGEVIGSGGEIGFSEELKEMLPDEAGK
ncbi:hypothetical protein Tco_0158561 [Tanacetum coccineum]